MLSRGLPTCNRECHSTTITIILINTNTSISSRMLSKDKLSLRIVRTTNNYQFRPILSRVFLKIRQLRTANSLSRIKQILWACWEGFSHQDRDSILQIFLLKTGNSNLSSNLSLLSLLNSNSSRNLKLPPTTESAFPILSLLAEPILPTS